MRYAFPSLEVYSGFDQNRLDDNGVLWYLKGVWVIGKVSEKKEIRAVSSFKFISHIIEVIC